MLLTMQTAWSDIVLLDTNHAGQIMRAAAQGALMGARGNSGVIRRRCDASWRYSAARLAEVVTLQWDILNSLSRLVAPGGGLLYSTCSIEPAEDEEQVSRFLDSHADFELVRQRKLFPSSDHDGAFAALLRRTGKG